MDAQRDLRSVHREFKRDKDAHAKWSHGSRPSAGCRTDFYTGEVVGGSESQREKSRPHQKYSDAAFSKKREHNIVKARSNWDMPQGRVREAVNAMQEARDSASMSRSVMEMLPSGGPVRRISECDDFIYSFDRAESPNRPLSLEGFMKTNPRETERLVRKEYEILDSEGETLRGQRAIQNLRKSPSMQPTTLGGDENDGFELV